MLNLVSRNIPRNTQLSNDTLHVNPIPVKQKNRDPLEFLSQKRQVTQSQYCAGLRLQLAFEIANRSDMQSADMGRDVVDGGRGHYEPSAKRLHACGDIALARSKLCADGFDLVRDVLERGLFLTEAAVKRVLTAERAQRRLNKQFKASLDTMAAAFGAPNN
jgi:hypothetical protein